MTLWKTILTRFSQLTTSPRPVLSRETVNTCRTYLTALITAQYLWCSLGLRAAEFQNGSFESPDSLPPGGTLVLATGDTRISGWVVGGTNQSLTWIKIADPSITYDGKYMLGFEKSNQSGGWIEQTFDTVPGKSYRARVAVMGIDFEPFAFVTWLRADLFSGTNGVIVSKEIPLASSIGGEWGVMSLPFTAVSGTTTIRFTEISQRQSTIRIDQVLVETDEVEVDIALYPGITVKGAVNYTYALQYQDSLATNSWITVRTFLLQKSPTLVFDTNGLSNPQKIYRAVRLP